MTEKRTPQQQLELVRRRYGDIAAGVSSSCCDSAAPDGACCGTSAPMDLRGAARKLGYTEVQLDALPAGQNLTLGCGNPLTAALLEPGMTVLDLGSGAGFDCFLAAEQVGATGRVIGVDMTPEMLARARAAAADRPNVEFRLGELAHLPVADATIDVILSNCVVNLTPDKAQVFREAWRVLRSGGRLAISDVVRIAEFPPAIAASADSLCSCIAGASSEAELRGWLAEAGFTDVRVAVNDRSAEFIGEWEPGSNAEQYVRAALIEARRT